MFRRCKTHTFQYGKLRLFKCNAYFLAEYSLDSGENWSTLVSNQSVAPGTSERDLLMFQADKTLDGDTKPLQLQILFQEVYETIAEVGFIELIQQLVLQIQQQLQLVLQIQQQLQLVLQIQQQLQLVLQQLVQHCQQRLLLQHFLANVFRPFQRILLAEFADCIDITGTTTTTTSTTIPTIRNKIQTQQIQTQQIQIQQIQIQQIQLAYQQHLKKMISAKT